MIGHVRSKQVWRILTALLMVGGLAEWAAASRGPDFNGDGYEDLAIGTPDEDLNGLNLAGVLHVMYGSADGLVIAGNQYFHQGMTDVPGAPNQFAVFASVFGWNDFNGDGFDDLAIGVRGQTIAGHANAGAVVVLMGSPAGLVTTGAQYWHLGVSGMPGPLAADDSFGSGLSGGDFNGDGFGDLAIGVMGRIIDTNPQAGAVVVLHGSAAGLTADGVQFWHQSLLGLPRNVAAAPNEFFGQALASGDFNGDGISDLAIGSPGENANAGAVLVLPGSPNGLATERSQWLNRSVPGEQMGFWMTVGNFNGDRFDDLAVSSPHRAFRTIASAGAVTVFHGSARRLKNGKILQPGAKRFPILPNEGDRFSHRIAAGDFDGDGFDDLAIGLPYRSVNGIEEAGAALILFGTRSGLKPLRFQYLDQDIEGLPETAEFHDRFGYALAARDFNGDGRTDLGVGAPYESINGVYEAGILHILYGAGGGLDIGSNQLFTQDMLGIPGEVPEVGDEFADYF